jgi:hypothetical protein
MPPFDRLRIDCTQEEARIESRNKQRGSDDENQALVAYARKGKRKGSTRGEASPEQWKKKDLARSSALLVISKATVLHNVHHGRKGKGSNKHHQQRWMRLQTSFKGSSY